MTELPELGAPVRLFPAPRADVEPEKGKPMPLRRVQDGAGNYGRFLPDAGGERVFDYFWHDRLMAGDVLLTDPSKAYARTTLVEPTPAPAPAMDVAPSPSPAPAPAPAPALDQESAPAAAPSAPAAAAKPAPPAKPVKPEI